MDSTLLKRYIDIKSTCGIYRIRCKRNGRVYIGSTSCFARRWAQHRDDLDRHTHANYRLQQDWDLYGSGAFVFEVVETCHYDRRLMREQHYIDTVNPYYNIQRNVFEGYHGKAIRRPPSLNARKAARSLRRTSLLAYLIVFLQRFLYTA